MRQLLYDELSQGDISAITEWLEKSADASSMEGLFWVDLSEDLLDPEQFTCKDDQPFCFAVEVGDSWVKFEFLIRSRTNFKSDQMRYANRPQIEFIMDLAEGMAGQLDIKT